MIMTITTTIALMIDDVVNDADDVVAAAADNDDTVEVDYNDDIADYLHLNFYIHH